jgi:UPF0755 protein
MTTSRAVPVLVAIGLLALLAVGIWQLSKTPGSLVNDPPPELRAGGTITGPVVVTVEEGDSAGEIGRKLAEAGVIQSESLFEVLVGLTGASDQLVAGEYEFAPGETTSGAVLRISQGLTSAQVVTFREGLRVEEVAALLEEQDIVPAADFLAALDDDYQATFLSSLPPDAGLEGFLFPATYGFSREETPHGAAQQMVSAFDERYIDSIQPRLGDGGPSLFDAVTLASIVEREARVPEERPVIASVFLNRLASGMPLQADPTVQYAIASDPASVAEFGYWKAELSLADLAVDSPYNTYVNPGLPPGPIASPGLDSILAVLEPAQTEYLFFVARADGSHAFAATLEEHQQNVCAIDPARPECG